MRRLLALALAALAFVSGCANVQPVVAPTAAADPAAGYVAGQFSRNKTRGFAFVLKSDQGTEYTMSMGEDSRLPTEVKDQTVAIKVPPGTYTVAEWLTYGTLSKEVGVRRPVSNAVLSRPFTVRAGSVVHLGGHNVSESTSQSYYSSTTYFRISPRRVLQADAKKAFADTYPNLAGLPFDCVLCVDTLR